MTEVNKQPSDSANGSNPSTDVADTEAGVEASAADPETQSSNHPLKERKTPSDTKRNRNRRVSVYASHRYQVRLFSPPRQRQKWGDDQMLPRVNWGDLFFDLFYVAAFYNLGNILVETPTSTGLLYFLGCFFPILHLWQEKMWYDSRFVYGDDIWHKVFEVAVLAVLATAISFISPVEKMSNPSKYVDMFGFSISLTICSFSYIVRAIECYFWGRGQRKVIEATAVRDIQWKSVLLVFYIAATVISGMAYFGDKDAYESSYAKEDNYESHNNTHRFLADAEKLTEGTTLDAGEDPCNDSNTTDIPILLALMGYVASQLYLVINVMFCFPTDGGHKNFTIPMNIDFAIHRHGEWTMLVLGESVLSLLIVDGFAKGFFMVFYCGIVTVVLLQYLHFRSQPHNPDSHATRRHKNAGVTYTVLFNCYSAALVVVGASYKLFLYESSSAYDTNRRLQWLSFLPPSDVMGENNRVLAASSSSCGPYGAERQQNTAHLFCGAMAIVFFCMDTIVLTHVGLRKEVKRCQLKESVCPGTGKKQKHYNYQGIILVVMRCAITVFMATLSQWVTGPDYLAEIGLAAVICQLINRFLGDIFFPYDGHFGDQHHHHHEGLDDENDDDDEYDEEYKWPNVTHPQSQELK